MRYNKTLFGYESEVDSSRYFLAEKGKTDPKAEMNASMAGMESPLSEYKNPNNHPACLFPGRYLYLSNKGLLSKSFDLGDCPDYSKFAKKLELKSVSVIFSSYYIDKPASAFGHTLLKLNKEDPLTGDLKSYGVDFSARVTTKNPLMYGLMGILGGFYGRFSLLPYFLKLREYNDYESRDLWEFELNLNQRDLRLFTAHLWDLNQALFDYYYFTENCSYHILRLVDAVKPQWKLWEETYPILIPVDTLIPMIKKKETLKGIYKRPSLYARAKKQLNNLDEGQNEFVQRSLSTLKLEDAGDASEKKQAQALDAMIDFLDFKYPSEIHLGVKNEKVTDFKRELLVRRSRLKVKSNLKNKMKMETFDYSHPSRKFRIGYRGSDNKKVGSGYELFHRFALQNIFEARGDVYSDFSLEMGKLKLFYRPRDEKLFFEQFELAHVEALRPVDSLEQKVSWNFAVGAEREDLDYKRGGAFLDVGVGGSNILGDSIFTLYLQTENSQLFKELNDSKYGLLGPNFQWFLRTGNFTFKANYKYYHDYLRGEGDVELWSLKAGFQVGKTALLSAEAEENANDKRSVVSLSWYY